MEDAKGWAELAMSAGPLWVVFGLLTFFMVKYVPQIVTKHINLVDTLCNTQAEIVAALHEIMGSKERKSDG